MGLQGGVCKVALRWELLERHSVSVLQGQQVSVADRSLAVRTDRLPD